MSAIAYNTDVALAGVGNGAMTVTSPAGMPAGYMLRSSLADLLTGFQTDGVEGQVPVVSLGQTQFGNAQRAFAPFRRLQANATGLLVDGPCLVTSIECVAPGSVGTATLDDATIATVGKRIASVPFGAATAGASYLLVGAGAGLLANEGLFWTNTTGGQWWVDILDGTGIAGMDVGGAACAYVLRSASGVALPLPAYVHSIRVITPGSAGALIPYSANAATAGRELKSVAGIAFGSLTPNQLVPIGAMCDQGLFLTLPTGGIVCVNYFPR